MKISFSTLGCPGWTLDQVLQLAERECFDGVELRFIAGDAALWRRPEFSGPGLGRTARRLADAGLAVPCVDTSCFFHHPDAADRARATEEGRQMIAVAAGLGARGIRIFGDRVQPGATREETESWIADGLLGLGTEAKSAGVEAWLESHGDFAAARATEAILARVADVAAVGVLWDPANAFAEFAESPGDGWAVIGPRVRHVHLKDLRPPADASAPRSAPWTPMLMGAGCFPAVDVVSLLDRAAFDGFVSYEWEKRWHPEIEEPEIALPRFARWWRSLRKPC